MYVKDSTGCCAPKRSACLDMVAGEAVFGATGPASTSCLESGWLELCIDEEVQKVLWSAVGN